MRPNQGLIRAAFFVFTVGIASAQQMPKTGVVDVPAIDKLFGCSSCAVGDPRSGIDRAGAGGAKGQR